MLNQEQLEVDLAQALRANEVFHRESGGSFPLTDTEIEAVIQEYFGKEISTLSLHSIEECSRHVRTEPDPL